MMQATYPLYISEQSPAPIRGFLVNAYLLYVSLHETLSACH